MSKQRRRNLEDQLRRAIRDSGMTQSYICHAARIDEGTLSCFMLGKQESMRLKTAQRLVKVLGLELNLDASTNSTNSRHRTSKSTRARRR